MEGCRQVWRGSNEKTMKNGLENASSTSSLLIMVVDLVFSVGG